MLNEDLDHMARIAMSREVLNNVLLHVLKLKVSDIYFQTDSPIYIKLNNHVYTISKNRITDYTMKQIMTILANSDDAAMDVMQGRPLNGSYKFRIANGQKRTDVRFRVNAIADVKGINISMRLNPSKIPKLTDIGMTTQDPIYQNMFPRKGGVLVTGPTDSGKTTLLYACIHERLLDPEQSFVFNSFESPIEGDLDKVLKENKITNKLVSQVEVPAGVANFNAGFDEALRRNSDIIMTGEVRTSEDVEGFVNGIIKTGRLLLATMHTPNIPSTINRMLNALSGLGEGARASLAYDLVEGLHLVVAQNLLTTVDKKRVAVKEHLVFDQTVKDRLHSVGPTRYSEELKKIMREKGNTIVDDAKIKLNQKIISQAEFSRFEISNGY
jgi:defect-in-organelle-trafficking protein DotB